MHVHTAVARNFAKASENKIHSDDIARRFGFIGALVPGVTVFGHLAWLVTRRFGDRWLRGSWVTTRFIKPAYDTETISLKDRETGADALSVECTNPAGVLLATLGCTLEATQPAVDPHAFVALPTKPDTRVEIAWDTVHVGEPFAAYIWTPDDAHNREYAARVSDETVLFRNGVLHPHAFLSQANQVLVRRFVMPAWIHTGSQMRFRRLLRVGDEIEVRAVPLDKWERKGHQFIKLYVAYVVGGEIAAEIWHTAIFRVHKENQAEASGVDTHSIS